MATCKLEQVEDWNMGKFQHLVSIIMVQYLENHLLPDAVVSSLQVGQHLQHYLLCIALVTPVLRHT